MRRIRLPQTQLQNGLEPLVKRQLADVRIISSPSFPHYPFLHVGDAHTRVAAPSISGFSKFSFQTLQTRACISLAPPSQRPAPVKTRRSGAPHAGNVSDATIVFFTGLDSLALYNPSKPLMDFSSTHFATNLTHCMVCGNLRDGPEKLHYCWIF